MTLDDLVFNVADLFSRAFQFVPVYKFTCLQVVDIQDGFDSI